MTIPDITTMLINLSASLIPVIYLFQAISYLLGMFFIFNAIVKLKQIAETRAGGGQKNLFIPLAHFMAGCALLFFPQAIYIASNSTFGSANVIAYSTSTAPRSIVGAMVVLLKMAGVLWFIRGAVLLAQSSAPGVQHGPKGLAFLCGGILALNLSSVIGLIRTIFTRLEHLL